MAGASMLVHVTHIDDSARGRQGPCVYFWGITHDRSLYLLMEKYLESIRQYLDIRTPPLNLNVLDQVCCVLINHQWHRARVPELKLSPAGTLDVICIDSGDTHTVPLAFVRTLDIPGTEAEHIREWPPLATKFILADMVAPRGPGSRSYWSEPAMMFLKCHVENRTWKAAPMGMYGEHQGVRLFDTNNQLLATIMIQQGLGVAAQTYHEALNMCEMMDKQPAYMKPAFNAFSAGSNVTTINNTLPPSFAIPATYRDHHPAFLMAAARSPKQSPIPPRAFVTNDIPSKGRHDVVITHIPDGPHKFYVQLKSEASDFLKLRKKLDSIIAHRAFRGVPKLGTPCLALSPSDKLCHRGLITAFGNYENQSTCTVYFADIGTQEPVNLEYVCEISDELLVPRLFAYRVSLFGVEEVAKLVGLNEIFTAIVNAAPYLQVEVVEDDEGKQKVNLYDNTGRSIREVLASIYANLSTTMNATPVAPSVSPPKMNRAAPACITEIPTVNLAPEETLFVVLPLEPGCFFGQLGKIPVKDLDDMTDELTGAYSSEPNPSLLYADAKSHLGHYGVVHWDQDNNFYRICVTREFVNDAEIRFIDYGNCLQIPRCKILAPLEGLTSFRHPPFAIHCKIDGDVMFSIPNWSDLMYEKNINVKIGSCVDGIYSVTLTNDPCNNEIAKVISSRITSKCNLKESTPEQCVRTDLAENVSEPIVRATNDRFRRNTDNGNSGRSHYVHPNAKDTNWRTTGAEDLTQSGPVRSTSKDCNWRSLPNQVQEVIRAPRGPPPSTGNEETKGPLGFQRLGQVEKSQPLLVKPTIETSPPVRIPEMPKPPPISAVQKQYTYSHQILPDANSQVQVACVVDPTNFYVHLSRNSTILSELVESLNKVYSDEFKPFIKDAKPGYACVVQYEANNRWYRGQILQLNETPVTIQTATVLFVDCGNIQRCSLKQVKAIDEEFVLLPPQAFHCRLNGLANSRAWTVEDKNTFEEITLNKILTATFADRDADGKFPVRLVNGSTSAVINEAFGAPCSSSVPPPTAGYTYLPVSQTPIDVSIAWYYNPGRIFTSPVDVSVYQNELDELEEFYSSLSPDELLEDHPCVGLPCVARFTEDERYYRSKILSIVDHVAKVLFVDYGNEQETPISKLKRMVPRFMQCPQLTWHSRLKGVKKMSSGPINPDPQKHIAACFLTGQTLKALFHSSSPDGNNGVFEVELNVPEIGDAAEYLIEQKVLDRISLDTQIKLAPQNLDFVPDQIISTNAVSPYAKSPTEFWIQMKPESVDVIMERIDQLTIDPSFSSKKNFTASVGKPCLAFFADDSRWYRALIKAVDGESAEVYYVDYGNCCMVNTNDLRDLPAEFAQQPALAFKCSLDGVNTFPENLVESFVSSVPDMEAITVKFFNVVDGVLYVRLYSSEDVKANEQLFTQSSTSEVLVEGSVENAMHVPPSIPEENLIEDLPEQLETVSQEPTESSETNRLKVYISYSSSPNQFWFQMRDNDAKLIKMSHKMEEMYDADVESFRVTENPIVDKLYGMKHPTFTGWYRSQIIGVHGNSVEAHFVDYGDTHTIPIGNIFNLPQQFADIPAMAIPGSLKIECSQAVTERFNALCYEPDKTHWLVFGTDENGQQFIESLFIGEDNVVDLLATEISLPAPPECVAHSDTLDFASITNDAGLSTISEILLEQSSRITVEDDVSKMISSTSDSSVFFSYGELSSRATVEDDPSKIISSTGDSSEVFVPCEELSSICPSTLGAEMTIEESEVTIEESSLLPAIDLNFAPGQKMSSYALAQCIESATGIWIQLEPATVDSLMDKIAETDVSQLATLEPQIDSQCLALFPDDGQWYRAVVNSFDATQANVTYIDYGNSSLVNVGDLRVLPTHFAQLPGLALKCALDGTQQNLMSSPTTEQCESLIAQEVLTVVFVSRTSEHLYVRLFDTSGSDLNEKLGLPESFMIESVASNLLEFNTLEDVEMSSPISKTAEPVISERLDDEVTLPLEVVVVRGVAEEPMVAIPIVVEHSESEEVETVDREKHVAMREDDFYQCFSDTVSSFVKQAVLEPNLEPKENDFTEVVVIAEPVADNLMQETEDVVPDVGNATNDLNASELNVTEDLNVSELNFTEDSNVTELNVTKDLNVSVLNVSEDFIRSEEKSSGDDDFVNLIKQLTDVSSTTLPSLESSLIDATKFEDSHVSLQPETEGLIETATVSEIPVQGPIQGADALYDERIAMQIKTEIIPDEGVMQKGSLYVSHIVSPGDFWVQLAEDAPSIGDIDQRLVEMGIEHSSQYVLLGPPVVGKLYAAKHPEFGYWYRAKLLKIDEDRAEVIFIDYGDKQILSVACIRQLSRFHQFIPPMAIHCKLSAVHLDCWPNRATEVMKTLCEPEYVCRAVFKDETSPILEVESLYIGNIDIVNAVLATLECEHPVDGSPQQNISQTSQSFTEESQVDAKLFFIRVDAETESPITGQDLGEDGNRLQVN